MKILIPVVLIVLMILHTSCLTSLQPLVTRDKIVTENRITGTWINNNEVITVENIENSDLYRKEQEEDRKKKKLLSAEEKKDSAYYANTYLVTLHKNGIDNIMIGALIRLNDHLYMDLTSLTTQNKSKPENDQYNFSAYYQPTFTIAKVGMEAGNHLTLRFLNGDFIQEQISAGNMHIKHEQDELFGSFLITASSIELQQFIQKYGDDDRLYSKENSVTLTRKG